jgi:hypothetical protein
MNSEIVIARRILRVGAAGLTQVTPDGCVIQEAEFRGLHRGPHRTSIGDPSGGYDPRNQGKSA